MRQALSDAAVRARALDPTGSFIVQAPAGSGKTETLTRRLLALLARVEKPEEILAITFTRKAAAEMRARVIGALGAAENGGPADPETLALARGAAERSRSLGWDLLENPGRLRVQTIDSFLAGLVGKMPWLSRLGAAPAIADRPEDLYEEAANLVLNHLEAGDAHAEALSAVLDHLDGHAADLRELLMGLLGRRDQWRRHRARIDPEGLRPELEECLASEVGRRLEAAAERLRPWSTEIAEIARFAAGNLQPPSGICRLAELQGLPDSDPASKSVWEGTADLLLTQAGEWRKTVNKNQGFPAGKGPEAGWKGRMVELLDALRGEEGARMSLAAVRRLPEASYSAEQWSIVSAVIRVVDLALTRLWQVMGARRQADFAEVALQALQALGDVDGPSDLLLALDRRISHILVDEFQDTSFLQCLLLTRLTEGWTPGDGRTLFVVGDPMQSIYRFREAEVGLFLKAWEGVIGNVPLEPLRIEANFRSQKGVVDWVNRTFPPVFASEPDPTTGAVPYSASVAVHPALSGDAVEFRASLGADDEAEAAELVELVESARKEGTVAVLVRSRTHLSSILPALQARGIRYRAQDLDPLGERPAVRDIASLAKALLHPGDRLSWLAVLRAPWCGLTLSDLDALAGGCDRPVPELLGDAARFDALSEDGRPRLARAWVVLRQALEEARRRTLRSWVEGTWSALGAPAYLTAQEMEDAEAAFSLLDGLDDGGEIRPLDEFDTRLDALFARPDPEADGSVEVMTIHKAKGLQFDTVLLPGLGRQPRRDGRRLLYWLETPGGKLLLAPLPKKEENARDLIADYIKGLDAEKDWHERTRLLYVAFTRAKRKVVAWGHAEVSGRDEGELKPRKGSLLEVLWPAVAGFFEGLAAPEEKEEAEERPPKPTLIYRLPSGWVLPEPSEAVVGSGAPQPREETSDLDPEFWWAGETARHVGTLTHRILERIAREGPEGWDRAAVDRLEPWVRARLAASGAAHVEMDAAAARVVEAVSSTLSDPRGRWILTKRDGAASELALAGVLDDGVVHRSVDRTFVDEAGTRWVVDFKTSVHEGADVEAFLAAEEDRYRPQLAAYASLLQALAPEQPVKAALYYPLLGVWREVDV